MIGKQQFFVLEMSLLQLFIELEEISFVVTAIPGSVIMIIVKGTGRLRRMQGTCSLGSVIRRVAVLCFYEKSLTAQLRTTIMPVEHKAGGAEKNPAGKSDMEKTISHLSDKDTDSTRGAETSNKNLSAQHRRPHRCKMRRSTTHHKQVPQGVCIRQPLIGKEGNARGIGQSAEDDRR